MLLGDTLLCLGGRDGVVSGVGGGKAGMVRGAARLVFMEDLSWGVAYKDTANILIYLLLPTWGDTAVGPHLAAH